MSVIMRVKSPDNSENNLKLHFHARTDRDYGENGFHQAKIKILKAAGVLRRKKAYETFAEMRAI